MLVELAARHAAAPPAAGLELVFTVAEEDGLRGAKELDLGSLRSPFGYVLDHASPIGEVITAAPTYQRLVAEFEGVEAHAGIRPEDGHSAIEAAAAAIGAMELGRLDHETTANVGVVRGGVASNVVAGHCRIECEARSLDERAVAARDRGDGRRLHVGRERARVRRRRRRHRGLPRLPPATELTRRRDRARGARALPASSRARWRPEAAATRTRSSPRGFDCVLLANGTEANHTPAESVGAARITEMLAVCEAIAELAGEAGE